MKQFCELFLKKTFPPLQEELSYNERIMSGLISEEGTDFPARSSAGGRTDQILRDSCCQSRHNFHAALSVRIEHHRVRDTDTAATTIIAQFVFKPGAISLPAGTAPGIDFYYGRASSARFPRRSARLGVEISRKGRRL